MTSRRYFPALIIAAAGSLAGCSAPTQQVVVPPATSIASAPAIDPIYTPADSILSGFDLADSPDDWQIGDRVLLAIRVTRPGSDTLRFLHIELLDKLNPFPIIAFTASPRNRPPYTFESSVIYTRLSLYDQSGRLIETAVGRYPEKIMGHGLYDGAAPSIGRPVLPDGTIDTTNLTDEQAEHEMLGWISLFSFSMSMNRDGLLSAMIKDVVARPSLLTLLFNRSISIGTTPDGPTVADPWSPSPAIGIDAVSLPLTCSIADKPGAVARVLCVRPVAPLGLSGGVVSVVGNNAARPDITFEVRLLAAKRGDKKRAFLPTTKDPEP